MPKRLKSWFVLSLVLVFIQSICLLVIPVLEIDNVLNTAFAVLFWVCLILYIASVILSSKERQKIEKSKFRVKKLKKSHIGFLKFFQNKEAVIFDVLLFISTALIIVSIIIKTEFEWLIAVGLFLWFISFNLHCLFNGKNYIYIKANEIYKKEHRKNEQKKRKSC